MGITALYERLSNDDDLGGDSLSIRNQMEYLENYAVQHDCLPFRHYYDDGYTGMNFQRPAFQEMLRDIENGSVDTVIVKDLSRFGRNYREAGFYLEKVFPSYKIRFIAILNNVDSAENENTFSVPIFNLINDWYSRDLSRRVRSSFQQMAKKGTRHNSVCLYGYVPDKNNRSIWHVDPPAKMILQKIFRWSLEGETKSSIARRLTEEKVLKPNDYYLIRNWDPRHTWHHQLHHNWGPSLVYNLMTNEEYTGVKILEKTNKPIRFENDHEPIIHPENWEILQRRMEVYEPQSPRGVEGRKKWPPIFFCPGCGKRLTAQMCNSSPGIGCDNPACPIPTPLIYRDIAEESLYIFRETMWNSIPDKKGLLQEINEIRNKNISRRKREIKKYLMELEDRMAAVAEHMTELYEQGENLVDEDILPRLLKAYFEERELLKQEHSNFDKPIDEEPVTEEDLYNVFLGCVHAFVRRVDITPKSKASKKQYLLYYLNVNIPQPPPRIIRRYAYTYVVHFITSQTSLNNQLLSLANDCLTF